MIDFEDLYIEKLVLHKIGNKMRNEGIEVSEKIQDLNESKIKELMLKFFLRPFKNDKSYNFFHESNLELNEIYYYAKNIFNNNDNFYSESINILKHLYEKSNHPQIKSGEFYMSYFKNSSLEGKKVDIIGIFKTENKDTYLKVNNNKSAFVITYDQGINIDKLDKGCLIINDQANNGYKVLIVDASSGSQNREAQYWKKNFLNLKELEDDHFYTNNFIKICNGFSNSIIDDSLNTDKFKESIKFKNLAYKYLEENNKCTVDSFVENVFEDKDLKIEFKEYKNLYEQKNYINPINNFDVSSSTVIKLKKKFNSYIRLDTGFDIKIDNDNFLEKGYDKEKNMSFYKLYFHNEK